MSKGNTISKSRSYTYDSSNGLLSTRTMPGGKTVQYSYDAYGNTTGVNFESGTIAWSLTGYNGLRTTSDIVLDNYSSPFKKAIVLDQYGHLDSLKITQTLQYGVIAYQDEKYIFDSIRGNLMQRQGVYDVTSIRYSYDSTDRLLTATDTYNNQLMAVTYAANGNITSKTGIGSYTYGSTSHPHAVTEVDNTDGSIGHSYQEVFYNSWGKMYKVQQTDATGLYTYNVIYGPDLQRVESRLDMNQQTEYEKFYWDDYEEKVTGSLTTRYWYINGPDGLIGIYIEEQTPSGTVSMSTLAITDHLGSIEELCGNNNGHFYGARYDEWGNREKIFSFYLSDDIDRGFCGHEHIEELGLINMNGRMYDPLLGRFLSPDPFVQAPTDPQNFNRYSYCLNNPLKYTDPDGEWFWIPAVVIGAYLGGSSVNGTFNPSKWDYDAWQTYAGIAVGGLAGYAGAAIGASVATSAVAGGASSITASVAGGMMGGMVSGGINGAGMTYIMGGNINDIMYNMTTGMLMGGFGGAISGGIGAAIGDFSGVVGGSFKNGMYELGHSALKGAASGLAEGAMMAAMEQDPNYLWKGAFMGAALNTGMVGLRIAALGTTFIPDSKYGLLEDYGQIYRRGSILFKSGSGITLGRNVSVKLTGDIEYDRYLLKHETGHLSQINKTGNAKFYCRTAKEYMTNGFFNTYKTSGTLEYEANYYAFKRLGYYYLLGIKRTTFP